MRALESEAFHHPFNIRPTLKKIFEARKVGEKKILSDLFDFPCANVARNSFWFHCMQAGGRAFIWA
jgi:hypothetical protein